MSRAWPALLVALWWWIVAPVAAAQSPLSVSSSVSGNAVAGDPIVLSVGAKSHGRMEVTVDWGDQSTQERTVVDSFQHQAKHVYEQAGSYTISIVVVEIETKRVGKDEVAIDIARSLAPLAATVAWTETAAGEPGKLRIEVTGTRQVSAGIVWGDESPRETIGPKRVPIDVTHTYDKPGEYPIEVAIDDIENQRQTRARTTASVAKAAVAPVPTPTPVPATEPRSRPDRRTPAVAPQPMPKPAPDGGGLPWPLIIGAVVLGLVVVAGVGAFAFRGARAPARSKPAEGLSFRPTPDPVGSQDFPSGPPAAGLAISLRPVPDPSYDIEIEEEP